MGPEGPAITGQKTMVFEYERPVDWAMATKLLAEPGAVAKMGGCDVLTRFRSGRLQARVVVGLNRLPGLDELSFDADGVRIGAAVTLSRLAVDKRFVQDWPLIAKVLSKIASPAIRSSATVVGNIAQGWSVGDLVPLFEVCDGELDIRGPSGRRRLSVVDYAKYPGNGALQPGEVIAALILKPHRDRRLAYERFCFKNGFDLPLVSVAISTRTTSGVLNDVRVAAVGGRAMPARCPEVEMALSDKRLDDSAVDAAAAAMGKWADPPHDFRASSDYRRHVLVVTLRRTLISLSEAGGKK
jgi:aerobic carbon-monoxide dehydrogenase medium subunit